MARTSAIWHFLAILAIAVVCGCAHTPRAPRASVTLVVMDGLMAPEARETRKSEAGWWFSSRQRFDSGEAGPVFGEAFAREFGKVPGIDVFPRTELRAYLAQKERMLARAHSELSPEERLRVLEEQSPLDYGRSLNADFVMTARIDQSRTIHNRLPTFWSSRVIMEVSLWDVEQGRVVWAWDGKESELFASQVAVFEKLASQARSEALEYNVFRIY